MNILVPIDFREQSLNALNIAIGLAKTLKLKISLLYVHQDKGALTSLFSSEQTALFDEAVLEKLQDLAKINAEKNNVVIDSKLVHHNSVHTAILDYADKNSTEIIVMGRGQKDNDVVIGANTLRILRSSNVPVITVDQNYDLSKIRNILLPLDLSKETRQKVNCAITLAKLFDADIKVISALWSLNNENIVNQLNAQLIQVDNFIKKEGVTCTVDVINSTDDAKTFVPIILKYVESEGDIDLILIMTQQETGFIEFFIGTHASELIRKSTTPVMSIIPHETGQINWGLF